MLDMAFNKSARKTIINLKNDREKRALTGDEEEKLKEAVSQIMSEIRGIDILANDVNGEYRMDTEDIFEHFKIINSEIKKEDKREIVELVYKSGNVKLLEMICKKENKDRGCRGGVDQQYSWKGEFIGYKRLIDLLQYVLKEECSPEIVLCIAKKVYGNAHVIYSGEQHLDSIQVVSMKKHFDYPDSVIKDCLKAAIELGYKNVVQVMLGGDIYHCIRLMKGEKFQKEKRFGEALKMIEETIAEVMSSWVCKQDLLKEIQGLLKEGIEIDIEKIGKQELINELEDRGIGLSRDEKKSKVKKLREKLKGEEIRIKLSKTVVGGLISALFFHYQNELMNKPFELGISRLLDKSYKEKEINELNKKIKDESFIKEKVLEKIKLLNKSSHISNAWFFREVLAAIVNDEGRFNKLKAVCVAICKEKMEELLRGAEVHEEVMNVLGFFGVEHNQIKTNTQSANDSSVPRSRSSSPGGSNNDQPGPSSELSGVQPISRSQSMNSLSSDESDIEIISRL